MRSPGLRSSPISHMPVSHSSERRQHPRLNTLGYVARLNALGFVGMVRVDNLSNGGAMIIRSKSLAHESPVRISFDCTNFLQGRVVWSSRGLIGIRFIWPIDGGRFIGKVVNDRLNSAIRAPRLPANWPGRVKSMAGSFATIVSNVSEKGMKICPGGDLPAGTSVEVTLERGTRVLGTVRWSDKIFAGIELSRRIAVDDLASKTLLGFDG